MKHYDELEWIFYKEKAFSKEKSKEMEEHLYECDECMEIFLSLIGSEEIDSAEETISSDFNHRTMEDIRKIKYKPKVKVEKYTESFKYMFGYYVAVAAVAIILTWGGFYSGLVDVLPQMAKSTIKKETTDKFNIVFSLSENIVNRTSNFINNFQISKLEEGLK